MSTPSAPAAPVAASTPVSESVPSSSAPEAVVEQVSEVSSEEITPEEQAELDSDAASEEKPALQAKTKVKVDGKEVELTEEELKKYASLGKASQKRMEEAAKIRKEHERLQADVTSMIETLQKNPEEVLKHFGIDIDKFAEDRINKKLEDAAKSPEQKEKEELLKKLEEYEKKTKEAEEKAKVEAQERLNNEIASKIEQDINKAFEVSDLPKSPYAIRKIADLLSIAAAQKIDLEASDVIPIVKKQMVEDFKNLSGILPEEMLEEILGNEKVSSLRKRYLKKLKTVPSTPKDIKPTGQDVKASKSEEKKSVSAKDFFKKMGSF